MSLVLFDFDDTLACSSWLTRQFMGQGKIELDHLEEVKNQAAEHTQPLEQQAIALLSLSQSKAVTVIVSNGEHQWIQFLLVHFFPLLNEFIADNFIDIVSARDEYQAKFPDDPIQWKTECFRQQITSCIPSPSRRSRFQVVSIGDGMFERVACKTVCAELGVPFCSLKLMEFPSPVLLHSEIQLIMESFNDLLCPTTTVPQHAATTSATATSPTTSTSTSTSESPVSTPRMVNFDLYVDVDDEGYFCIYHFQPEVLPSDSYTSSMSATSTHETDLDASDAVDSHVHVNVHDFHVAVQDQETPHHPTYTHLHLPPVPVLTMDVLTATAAAAQKGPLPPPSTLSQQLLDRFSFDTDRSSQSDAEDSSPDNTVAVTSIFELIAQAAAYDATPAKKARLPSIANAEGDEDECMSDVDSTASSNGDSVSDRKYAGFSDDSRVIVGDDLEDSGDDLRQALDWP